MWILKVDSKFFFKKKNCVNASKTINQKHVSLTIMNWKKNLNFLEPGNLNFFTILNASMNELSFWQCLLTLTFPQFNVHSHSPLSLSIFHNFITFLHASDHCYVLSFSLHFVYMCMYGWSSVFMICPSSLIYCNSLKRNLYMLQSPIISWFSDSSAQEFAAIWDMIFKSVF